MHLLHWKHALFLPAVGRWPVRQTVEQKSCVEPFLWNAVWPFSRTYGHLHNHEKHYNPPLKAVLIYANRVMNRSDSMEH